MTKVLAVHSALAMVILALTCPLVYAQYRWTDAQGHVQYGDTPPPGVDARQIQNRTSSIPAASAASGDNSAASTPAEAEQAFRKRQIEREMAQKKQAEAAKAAERQAAECDSARGQLAGLEAGGRFSRFRADGEREFLSDTQIEQQRNQVRAEVDRKCK